VTPAPGQTRLEVLRAAKRAANRELQAKLADAPMSEVEHAARVYWALEARLRAHEQRLDEGLRAEEPTQ
jgi:hypothetical protein